MRRIAYMVFFVMASAGIVSQCGTNTDEPVYPLYSVIAPVSPPALTAVSAVFSPTDDNPTRYEFDISYFVTNQEENFIGYNLYIASSAIASNGSYVGTSGSPYLENGISPSFSHTRNDFSTETSNQKTRRIAYFTPAPSPTSYQFCELYYFRLTAVVDNGTESNSSPQRQSCAASDTGLCPTGTPCNP